MFWTGLILGMFVGTIVTAGTLAVVSMARE